MRCGVRGDAVLDQRIAAALALRNLTNIERPRVDRIARGAATAGQDGGFNSLHHRHRDYTFAILLSRQSADDRERYETALRIVEKPMGRRQKEGEGPSPADDPNAGSR